MSQLNDTIDSKHLTTSETDAIKYGKTNSVEKSHPPVIDIDKAMRGGRKVAIVRKFKR